MTSDPPEVHQIRQVEAILYAFQKFQHLKALTEMNGTRCARRQMARLTVYDREQRSPNVAKK